jgi:hypothetical protein
MKCPICNEGQIIKPYEPVPDWLRPPVGQCTECGDMMELDEDEIIEDDQN